MTTFQKTIVIGSLALAAGTGFFHFTQTSHEGAARSEKASDTSELLAQLQAAEIANKRLANAQEALQEELIRLRKDAADIHKLRAEVARFRTGPPQTSAQTAASDATEVELKSWVSRVNQLKTRIQQMPEHSIPELEMASEQDWLSAAKGKLETDEDYRKAMAKVRSAAESRFATIAQTALNKFMQINNGQFPQSVHDLAAFMDPSVPPATFDRWQFLPADDIKNVKVGGDWVITQRTAVDMEHDSRMIIGPKGYGSSSFNTPYDPLNAGKPTVRAKN